MRSNIQDSDSEPENISVGRRSTPVKTQTATNSNTTPSNGRNKLFCNLDCSQAYHCLQQGDQRSIEMLAIIFASRKFGYLRLAQGFSRALSAFPSFIRECLDIVIKADRCAQYVDDIGVAAIDAEQLLNDLRATFQCIQKVVWKLKMPNCHFGATEIDFLL